MPISLFDLFSIGVGPSSSHTVGPMRAAQQFMQTVVNRDLTSAQDNLQVTAELYGSLALTGKGHGTDMAVIMGLSGAQPETIEPDSIPGKLASIAKQKHLYLSGHATPDWIVQFDPTNDLMFHYDKTLPKHANGMRFTLYQGTQQLLQKTYYSVGGGFVVDDETFDPNDSTRDLSHFPYPYTTAAELLTHCQQHHLRIANVVRANERIWRTDAEIDNGILHIWHTMADSIDRGCQHTGILPGGLKVKRRAADLYQKLSSTCVRDEMNWINLYALAVNEENAAGGRIVTAPTNGAAGIIPAVIKYYLEFCEGTDAGIIEFMLTATAIGILYKEGASISAAEMGCQGEVGVACSMAAAGLCAALGGSIAQIENAAEIGMEHNLGLTCDPIKGLVQIPCIERNAMGAVQAINTAKLTLMGDGEHHVSLDAVIKTMRETGEDMKVKYKETAQGGLAVNQPEC